MKTKHRAYALLEVLVIMTALVVLLALSVKPMRQAISEVPRANRVFRTWNVTCKALEMLKQDVEHCEEIVSLQDNTLTLRTAAGQITYEFDHGRLLRGIPGAGDASTWKLPHVRINAQLWQDAGKPYALQITTWNQQTVQGAEQIRLKQSYVYFQKGLTSK
ncbi:MAG: hypothetical protein ACYTET_06920 [Planctomycetota bacterium]|jgi:hypothetical protein